ncbi:Chromatin remodeling protein EBS [Melia azedarach]|uniref:Chromatin remodeling protein EBS n=1 Tax=Melia azedarach TaxID=155640 RepID=A0ACC1X653_MELAZ|nr:Chromatin remodeling protein EBS [Melia azedarach]
MSKTRPGIATKTKTGKRDLESYTIRGNSKVVRVGDCVLMRPSDNGKPPYVARIEKIESDARSNVKVRVCGTITQRNHLEEGDNSMERESSFYRTTTMCIVLTQSRESALSTLSRTILSLRMLVLKITTVDLSIRLLQGVLHQTELLCIANVRCHITQIISWYNVRGAWTGIILLVWA